MARLSELISSIATRLRDLTLSQRVAIMLSGVLAAGSLLWIVGWAASPEMVPLLRQPLEPEEIARVQAGLDMMNEPSTVKGGLVFIRAASYAPAIIARLQQNDQMPASTSVGFASMVAENNPWLSQAENERRWKYALKLELEKVLNGMDGVSRADVFLNMGGGRSRFTRNAAAATASIMLWMKDEQTVPRKRAIAAAKLVAGAVQSLKMTNVYVVDGQGNDVLNWEDEGSGGGSSLTRAKREQERRLEEKIRRHFDAIAGIRVSVQVELETASRENFAKTLANPVAVKEETDKSERTKTNVSGQPGVQPNVGAQIARAGGQSTEERTTIRTENIYDETTERSVTPPGEILRSFAAINIPYSYLEQVAQRQKPEVETPVLDDVLAAFDDVKERIVSQAMMLVRPQEDTQVDVNWHYDLGTSQPDAASAAGGLDQTLTLVRRFGPQSGLALLALFSFGLMFRMARKTDGGEAFGIEIGLPKDAIDAAKQAAEDVKLGNQAAAGSHGTVSVGAPGESVVGAEGVEGITATPVGDTLATDGLLVGQEVSQETVQIKTMIDQVAAMVEKNPDAVSSLLEKWIQDSA